MRVDIDRSRNGYRPHYGRKPNIRLKRRNYHHEDSPYSRNQSSRVPLKSRSYYQDDNYPSPSLNNRIPSSQLNYHDNHSASSSRFDRDNYSTQLPDPITLSNEPPLTTYTPRVVPSYYNDTERNRYSPPPSSSSNYRRENSSYRNDLYSHEEFRPITPLSHSYNDTHRVGDYNNRSERYKTAPNRNSPSRDYSMVSCSSPPPSSSFHLRNQYIQSNSPVRDVEYRRRDYGRTAMEHSYHPDRSRSHWEYDARSTRTIRR